MAKQALKCYWCERPLPVAAKEMGGHYYHGKCLDEQEAVRKMTTNQETTPVVQYQFDEFLWARVAPTIAALKDKGKSKAAQLRHARAVKIIFGKPNMTPTSFHGVLNHFGVDIPKALKALEKYK